MKKAKKDETDYLTYDTQSNHVLSIAEKNYGKNFRTP